jgi:hypothetical protein
MSKVLAVLLVVLFGPIIMVLVFLLVSVWLDLVFLGEFKGRRVWRGLWPELPSSKWWGRDE